ncbi:sporulation protein YjcZ [Paenibacillus sp. yr247]|nr:sporulation protein YjcZ [Paenibacillus sp. yr247]
MQQQRSGFSEQKGGITMSGVGYSSTAVVLVLYILLVIILATF